MWTQVTYISLLLGQTIILAVQTGKLQVQVMLSPKFKEKSYDLRISYLLHNERVRNSQINNIFNISALWMA